MDNFDLRGYLAEGRLYEEETNFLFEGEEAETAADIPDNILKIISKATKLPVEKVKQITKEKEKETVSEDKVDEGLVAAIVTIVGLIPLAMEVLGGLSNWISRNTGKSEAEIAQLKSFNKKIEEKEKYIKSLDKKDDKREMKEREALKSMKKQRDNIWGSDFGQWMKEWSHKLHKVYTWPIRTFLKGYGWVAGIDGLKDKKTREKVANILYVITMATIGGTLAISHLSSLHGVGPFLQGIGDGVKSGKSITDIVKSIGLAI